MIEYKYDKEHYIYNKNRNAIKKWLLNPPPKHHEKLIEMMGFEPYGDNAFIFAFENCYYEDVEELCKACCEELNIDVEGNFDTFEYLLMALSRFLVPSERLKKFKVHLKKIKLGEDFTTNT